MFKAVLPGGVSSKESALPIGEDWPEARASVAGAVPRRQCEHVAGRLLARELLGGLGHPGFLVAVGAQREPVWPFGVTGSITHAWSRSGEGRVAVAVAVSQGQSVGIDLEPDEPLPPCVLEALRHASDDWPTCTPARLGFSAKEAFYKAVFPLTRRFLDFQEVAVRVAANTLVARLLVAAPPFTAGTEFQGRWVATNGWVRAGFVVEPPWQPR